MVRICCVHPAITEEREKRYIKNKRREKKQSLRRGRETADHRQWRKQHALLYTCMHTCTHMHAGSLSLKTSYGHAAMHRMRWVKEWPGRRNVAEAKSSTCWKEVSTFEMTASASLTLCDAIWEESDCWH